MAEQKDSNSSPLYTSDEPRKVPPTPTPFEWRRYAVVAALLFPVLMCAAFYLHDLLDAIFAVMPPFVIALVIALLLDPVVDFMEARGIRRTLSVTVVFLVFLGALIVIGVFGAPALASQASSLASNMANYVGNIKGNVNQFLRQDHSGLGLQLHRTVPGSWIVRWHSVVLTTLHLPKNFDVLSQQLATQIVALVQHSLGGLPTVLAGSVSTLFDAIIVVIVGFYLLIDIDRMKARFYYLTPEKYRKRLAEIGQDVGQVFADYLRGLLIVCTMYGCATTVLLYLLAYFPHFGHVGLAQYALLIGVSAGVLYAIPYIGSLTVGLVTFLVALAAGGFGFAVFAVMATLVLNQTFDNIIAPRVVGAGVGLNPVLVIFSLSLGGCLFQFWGLLLSVPIAGSVQAILFRLIPKLTTPTPKVFLLAHGVPPNDGKITKSTPDAPSDVKAKQEADRDEKKQEAVADVAAEKVSEG